MVKRLDYPNQHGIKCRFSAPFKNNAMRKKKCHVMSFLNELYLKVVILDEGKFFF